MKHSQIKANEKKVKKAFLDAQIDNCGWNYCQRCGRSDLPLQLAHKENKGMGGSKRLITPSEAELLCQFCHGNEDHGERYKESEPKWRE